MKWIKYNVIQSRVNTGTDKNPVYKDILLEKKIGYCSANLSIAKQEAYQGKYTIEEDDSKEIEPEPLAIGFGGTGAKTAGEALKKLGGASIDVDWYVGNDLSSRKFSLGFTPKAVIISSIASEFKGISTLDNPAYTGNSYVYKNFEVVEDGFIVYHKSITQNMPSGSQTFEHGANKSGQAYVYIVIK